MVLEGRRGRCARGGCGRWVGGKVAVRLANNRPKVKGSGPKLYSKPAEEVAQQPHRISFQASQGGCATTRVPAGTALGARVRSGSRPAQARPQQWWEEL